jgi:putative exosortase-associated protein (TIGR04073 family)
MRKTVFLLAATAMAGFFVSGCANTEQKLGRGMNNMGEIVRCGELRRSVEQTALFEGPEVGYTTGFVKGLNKTLARTGIGMYEIVTSPFPPYGPVCTSYLTPAPAYPDNYSPGIASDSLFATDTRLGFSGGDVAPFIPGSRFSVFDTQ